MLSFPLPLLYATLRCIIEIDECLMSSHNCSKFATCTNKPGSFECNCKDGYRGDGYYCEGTLFVCLCVNYAMFSGGAKGGLES